MADYTWPFTAGDPRFAPEAFDEALEFNVELSVARSGKVTTLSLPGGRFRCTMQFPDESVANIQFRRQLLAFLASLRGGADRLLLWNLLTPQPLGNMRQAPTLASTLTAGATTASLTGARAGNNLLRKLEGLWQYGAAGWALQNSTITANSAADPVGGNTAWTLTRTAAGNHYAIQSAALASTANRTVTAVVWLKAGTLTGNVTLRIRDGAGITDVGTSTVTPTSTWTPYFVHGTFGASSAANIQLTIDPVNDAGAAGDTLLVWNSDIRLLSGVDTRCTTRADSATRPTGLLGAADEVTRTASGDAFTGWSYPTTSHAGQTFTFSVWLKAGTYTGAVNLVIRDGAFTIAGLVTVTSLPADWQRYSVTATFGAAPVSGVLAYIDPADSGSVGETYFRYGEQLELGATPTGYEPAPTLLRGDFIGIGGQRVMLTQDATLDYTGAGSVTFQPAHRAGASSGTSVTVVRPTTRYVPTSDVVQMPARGDRLPGFAVELVEE